MTCAFYFFSIKYLKETTVETCNYTKKWLREYLVYTTKKMEVKNFFDMKLKVNLLENYLYLNAWRWVHQVFLVYFRMKISKLMPAQSRTQIFFEIFQRIRSHVDLQWKIFSRKIFNSNMRSHYPNLIRSHIKIFLKSSKNLLTVHDKDMELFVYTILRRSHWELFLRSKDLQ